MRNGENNVRNSNQKGRFGVSHRLISSTGGNVPPVGLSDRNAARDGLKIPGLGRGVSNSDRRFPEDIEWSSFFNTHFMR